MFDINQIHAMDRNSIFSGQIILRESGTAMSLDMTTRLLFGFVGIMAVPKDTELKPEHQYTLAGFNTVTQGNVLTLGGEGTDMTEKIRGASLGQLLTSPIWKI